MPAEGAPARGQVALRESITSFILESGRKPGDSLPTEFEFMEMFRVSRNPLREAMKTLQAAGIVEVRHGYGTYVGSGALHAIHDGLAFRMMQSVGGDRAEVAQLLEVREAMEFGLGNRVISTYLQHPLDRLEELVGEMEAKAQRNEEFNQCDLAFHEEMYRPLGNPLVLDFLRIFWRAFHEVDDRLPRSPYPLTENARWHRDILEAVRRSDRAEYERAIVTHFSGIATRLHIGQTL